MKTSMAICVPFLAVPDIAQTIKWYESIGFKCTGTNHIWEPGCELNWAELDWEGATFMIGPDVRSMIPEIKGIGLYFQVESIDKIIEALTGRAEIIEINPETFYGRKEVVFKDINGLQVTFSCEPDKK